MSSAIKLGWMVRSVSPFRQINRYPENAEAGVVREIIHELHAQDKDVEVVFIHPSFKYSSVEPHERSLISTVQKSIPDKFSCSQSNSLEGIDYVFIGHPTDYMDKFGPILESALEQDDPPVLIYHDSDGELYRKIGSETGGIHHPTIRKYAEVESKFICMTSIENPEYQNELKNLNRTPTFYVGLITIDLPPRSSEPQKQFGCMRMYAGSLAAIFDSEHCDHLAGDGAKQSKGYWPHYEDLIRDISKFRYLLPSGFHMDARSFRQTSKLGEAYLAGSSAVIYVKDELIGTPYLDGYPKELIITESIDISEFINNLTQISPTDYDRVLSEFQAYVRSALLKSRTGVQKALYSI